MEFNNHEWTRMGTKLIPSSRPFVSIRGLRILCIGAARTQPASNPNGYKSDPLFAFIRVHSWLKIPLH
jgi:hypothetical protein